MANKAPKSEGKASPGYEDPRTLARFDKVEGAIGKIESTIGDHGKNLKFVKDTNWLIIIVIFVMILGLAFAAIYQFTSALKSDTESRNKLNQSVENLTTEVKVLQKQIDQRSSDATTPQPNTQPTSN